MFDVRAVSRFFASPKAGRKCPRRNVLCARASSFFVPSVQVIRSLHVRLFYSISTSHAWCIRLGYSICSSWWTSILCHHPLKSSNLAAVLEELCLEKWRAGLSMYMCTSLQVAHSCTTLPANVGCRWHVLKAVMRMGASFGRSVQSCLVWQWDLFLNEFERDGLKWLVIDFQFFFVLCVLVS